MKGKLFGKQTAPYNGLLRTRIWRGRLQ